MTEINPAVMRQYEIYRQKQAQRVIEQLKIELEQEQQRKQIQKIIEATQKAEIHTARKDYVCDFCHKPILKGTRYRRRKIQVGYGWSEGSHFVDRITHLVCPIEGNQ